MYDSWQQIDDDGLMMDWESPMTVRSGDPWHHIEAVRRAVLERMLLHPNTYPWNVDQLPVKMGNAHALAHQCHNNITRFLTPTSSNAGFQYIDHTDNGGNWDEQEIIPYWTEQRALDALGDDERIPPLIANIAEWLHQSYRLLNLLKWHQGILTTTATQWQKGINDWERGTAWGAAYCFRQKYLNSRWDTRSRTYLAYYSSASESAQGSADVYTFSERFPANGEYGNNSSLLSSTEGRYKRSSGWWGEGYGSVMADYRSLRTSNYWFTMDSATQDPVSSETCGSRSKISSLNSSKTCVIEKFDGPNGFKFRGDDW